MDLRSCLCIALSISSAAGFTPPAIAQQRRVIPVGQRLHAVRLQEAAPEVSDPPAVEKRSDLFTPLSDVELAEQSAKLDALAAKWKKREEFGDYKDSMRSGFGPSPERINGRTAMFFIVVGLVTEYYTGQSLPQQVYTMLQTLSIVEVCRNPLNPHG